MRGGDTPVELHGGDGHDRLQSLEGGRLFGDDGDDTLRGGVVDTILTGGKGADNFICGGGDSNAIITDFNAAEGDTKTEGCENALEESVSVLDNNDNDDTNANTTETGTTTSTPSSGVVEDSSTTEEDASSLPSTTTTTTSSNSSDDEIETIGVTETVEAQTMEVLPNEKP
jgi:hypothetical protein